MNVQNKGSVRAEVRSAEQSSVASQAAVKNTAAEAPKAQDSFKANSASSSVAAQRSQVVQLALNTPPVQSRGLSDREQDELRKIYGNSIDYSKVQVAQQAPVVEAANAAMNDGHARAFVVGNTVYLPKADYEALQKIKDQPGNAGRGTLAHEMGHVWQFQNKGPGYLPEAVGAQLFGDAYNFPKALAQGKAWSQMDPEQQAEMASQAYMGGYFDQPGAKFVARETNTPPGYESRVIGPNDPVPEGFTDYSKQMWAATQELQSGGLWEDPALATPTPGPVPTPPTGTPTPSGTPGPTGTPTP